MCSSRGLSETFLHFYGPDPQKALFQQAEGAPALSGHCFDHRPQIVKFSTFMIASTHMQMNMCNCVRAQPRKT